MGLSGRRNARHACPAWRRNGMKMLECVRNALVIAPHPDDEVLGCGGTIARLTSGGAQVHVAIVTRAGPDRFDPELADTGVAEARAAHACLGVADPHFLKFPAAGLDRVAHANTPTTFFDLVSAMLSATFFCPLNLHLPLNTY